MHSKDGEENKDQKRSGRYKVRIIGHHPRSCNAVKSSDLPWAITMMPVTTPYSSGAVRSATPQLEPGDWVIGFFLDKEQQIVDDILSQQFGYFLLNFNRFN